MASAAFLAALLILPGRLWADTAILNFTSDTEGFVDTGSTGGSVAYSATIGAGSLHLTNPSGWIWRGRLDVNSGSTGIFHDFYAAFTQAGLYGGTLRFDLILTSSAATGISGGFGGISYLVGLNQDSASGGGWDQLSATALPAGAFPIGSTTTIPVQITLVPTTTTPVSGSDSVLSLRSDSTWYQIQLGTSAYNLSAVDWYVDNVSVQPNAPPPPPPPPDGVIILEAEAGTLMGSNTWVSTATPGYFGTGYVTGFQTSTDMVVWNFTGSNGFYRATIRFHSPSGPKGYDGSLNGYGLSGTFPQTNVFAGFDAGFVQLLAGANTLQIGGGWGYYDIDRVVLAPVPAPLPPAPVPAALADPLATFAAHSLMAALVADYGKHTWAGQHDASDIAYIQNTAGRKPVIIEGDFMDYSPSRVQRQGLPANYTENMIALESAGHVLSFCWHWNAPTNLIDTPDHEWWRGFYTHATTFDVAAALADTNSVEYSLILRDIDAIAGQLKKVSSNNIPVLWRPLHESEGGWFWWGAKGSGPFKQLWRLLFNRLTTYHGLHNLIWALASEDPDWYPGDDVVDVIGVDGYPNDRSDALSPRWEALKGRFDGRKLIALTEFGGVPDIERMQQLGVWWSWFSPWSSIFGASSMPTNTVIRIYQSPAVITLDELNAVPPQFTGIGPIAGGALELSGTGPRGATYHLVATTDLAVPLANWLTLTNGKFAGGVFTFTDLSAPDHPQKFYRLLTP